MGKFTQKHYRSIADTLKDLVVSEVKTVPTRGKLSHLSYHAEVLIDSLCDLFQEDNPNFKKALFIKKCGFEPWDDIIMGRTFKRGNDEFKRCFGRNYFDNGGLG